MKPLKQDLSIFEKLELEREPIAIKYEFFQPEGFEQLDKAYSLCEMAKIAQQKEKPFYITAENEDCAGKGCLGMMKGPTWGEAGLIGEDPGMGIFQERRANMKCIQHYKMLDYGTANYAVFSKLSQLTFEPDLLMFVAPPEKAELILRAMAYSTGEMYESHFTPILQCSWLFSYPFVTQKVNFVMTGMSFGMRAREVYPSGLVIVSVPYNWIPIIAKNLEEMPWVLPAWTYGRDLWTKHESAILANIHQKTIDADLLRKK